ncbi:helix-turn-helix domain-containing protein [Xanthomonas sacchari]
MPGGRPSDYSPEYCQTVIDLGKQGKSVVQMACALDVAKSTLYVWAENHPEFSDAFTRAKQWAQDWWETQGQCGLTADKFNASLWSRSMAARFPEDYQERKGVELTGAGGGPVETITSIRLIPLE